VRARGDVPKVQEWCHGRVEDALGPARPLKRGLEDLGELRRDDPSAGLVQAPEGRAGLRAISRSTAAKASKAASTAGRAACFGCPRG